MCPSQNGEEAMPIIDFRYRPSTRESLDSFINHPVYSEYMKVTPFASKQARSLEDCVEELHRLDIVKAVYTGRDCSGNYAFPDSNNLVLDCGSIPICSSVFMALIRTGRWMPCAASARR